MTYGDDFERSPEPNALVPHCGAVGCESEHRHLNGWRQCEVAVFRDTTDGVVRHRRRIRSERHRDQQITWRLTLSDDVPQNSTDTQNVPCLSLASRCNACIISTEEAVMVGVPGR